MRRRRVVVTTRRDDQPAGGQEASAASSPAMACRMRRLDGDWDVATTFLAGGAPRALWMKDAETWMVGHGVAWCATTEGPQRFQDARKALAAVASRMTIERGPHVPEHLHPRAIGGFAFDPAHAGTGAWSGFPAMQFWLPRSAIVADAGVCYEVQCQAVPVGDAADEPAECLGTFVEGPSPDPDTSLEGWQTAVTTAVEAIVAGDVAKVVLARKRRGPALRPDADAALVARLSAGAGAAYIVEPMPGHRFLGKTPETLVAHHGGHIHTHALAGSAPRHADEARDERVGQALLASQKDILEHELVAAFIRERLSRLGLTPQQGARTLRKLATVQHLETPISCQSESAIHILDLAAALHPTPAVAGSPQEASLALIGELEPYRRGWYAGAVGWIDLQGNGQLNVALRCALATPDTTIQFAGAGIVAGSNPDTEWDETEHKLAALDAIMATKDDA